MSERKDKSELNPPPRFDGVFERGLRNMDRPELPKDIPALCVVNMVEGRGYPNCIEPLIKEAKREERKRIMGEIEIHCGHEHKDGVINASSPWWQALRGEK